MEREDIKSLNFIVKEKFKKSISDILGYTTNFKLEKKGSEIKDKLKVILVERIIHKNLLFKQLQECAEKIGSPPMGLISEHMFKGLRHKLQIIPYKYSYEQCYPPLPKIKQNNPIEDVLDNKEANSIIDESSTIRSKMQEYNKKLNEYLALSIDSIFLKAIIDNIKEKKNYDLTPAMLIKLGF